MSVGSLAAQQAQRLSALALLLLWTPTKPRQTDEERAARDLRERYGAATRARDELWVGFC